MRALGTMLMVTVVAAAVLTGTKIGALIAMAILGAGWAAYDEFVRQPRKRQRREDAIIADEALRQRVRAEWARRELDEHDAAARQRTPR